MKKVAIALALCSAAGSALAGGIAEPVMAPAVVADAASSADDNWAGIVLTLLLIGTALQ